MDYRMDNAMNELNNRVYADGELKAAFLWTTDAIDYVENESYGYENGMTLIDANGISRHYLNGEITQTYN
jgi:hypothetical protein